MKIQPPFLKQHFETVILSLLNTVRKSSSTTDIFFSSHSCRFGLDKLKLLAGNILFEDEFEVRSCRYTTALRVSSSSPCESDVCLWNPWRWALNGSLKVEPGFDRSSQVLYGESHSEMLKKKESQREWAWDAGLSWITSKEKWEGGKEIKRLKWFGIAHCLIKFRKTLWSTSLRMFLPVPSALRGNKRQIWGPSK